MSPERLRELLEAVRAGRVGTDAALEELRRLPFEDLGFAKVDHHRALRQGFPEVVFGAGKTPEQAAEIVARIRASGQSALVTRATAEQYARVRAAAPEAVHHEAARAITASSGPAPRTGKGTVLVLSAGTSDQPVAEEARVVSEFLGNETRAVRDVGVAGLHRLLAHSKEIAEARVLIVVAGMEGALPSVVGGLVDKPVIAVPTSVGYGASFGGIAALLGMLNSCASGVTVVNIDNGFGAAYAASLMNRL